MSKYLCIWGRNDQIGIGSFELLRLSSGTLRVSLKAQIRMPLCISQNSQNALESDTSAATIEITTGKAPWAQRLDDASFSNAGAKSCVHKYIYKAQY